MILVYIQNITPRIKYIFNFIFNEILGIPYQLTSEKRKFVQCDIPKINYSQEYHNSALNIYPHTLLFENEINEHDIKISIWNKKKIFFQSIGKSDLPFDPFAASFYMISRFEEYLPFTGDEYGRFKAEESLAYKNDFLEEPVVDQWALILAKEITQRFDKIKFPGRKFKYIPTIDIDNAYAYKYKGILRILGAFIKAILIFELKDNLKRIKVLFGIKKDPFDTYDKLERLHKKYGFKPIFFFLIGKYGKYDKNLSFGKKKYQELIKKISNKADVGLHPSYGSNINYNELKLQVENLSQLLGESVKRSRQHFLKLSLPKTYRNLINLQVKEDYSLGFASRIGFRAGTCTPFYFFDLNKNKQEALKIIPFQVMDGTLNQYMKLNQIQAIDKIKKIVNAIKEVNGVYISIWHNESIGEQGIWNGWTSAYEEMLQLCNDI